MVTIRAGAVGEHRILVTSEYATNHLGMDQAQVLSTPQLIGQLEIAARDLIQPFLNEGEDSVGTDVQVKHLAATPLGMSVVFRARVVSVDGQRVRFAVEAEDEQEKIAEGVHERFVVNVARFASRLVTKAGGGRS